MIEPRIRQRAEDVAGHYDELDAIYRAVWGEHVHHGLWTTGRETRAAATEALSLAVAERLGLKGIAETASSPARGGVARSATEGCPRLEGSTPPSAGTPLRQPSASPPPLAGEEIPSLVDIGCGYGATAALFAARFGTRVTGLSLSAAQIAVARARADPRLDFHVRDWLDNGLPAGAYDAAYAIESSEHMPDKPRFFAEAARVLKPGGRLAVCAWLAADAPRRWQVDRLLEPICREGRLPGMGTAPEYRAMAEKAGLVQLGYDDMSARVARTWTICARRFALRLLHDSSARRLLIHGRDRAFALSVPRLILSYRTGAMRYGIFTFRKPLMEPTA